MSAETWNVNESNASGKLVNTLSSDVDDSDHGDARCQTSVFVALGLATPSVTLPEFVIRLWLVSPMAVARGIFLLFVLYRPGFCLGTLARQDCLHRILSSTLNDGAKLQYESFPYAVCPPLGDRSYSILDILGAQLAITD